MLATCVLVIANAPTGGSWFALRRKLSGASLGHPVEWMAGPEGEASWRKALQGRPTWVSPDPSSSEVVALEEEFPWIVRVPEEEQREELARWEGSAVVACCFGHWVAPEATVREFQRAGVSGGIEAYDLANGFYVFNLTASGERGKVVDRLWTVNGQVVAVEEWRRGFLPKNEATTWALLWVRLSHLSAEYWGEAALQRLLEEAGEFVFTDSFTAERKRLGYAWVCIRADLSWPLVPGVRIGGPSGNFWRRFAYENLAYLCSGCGSILHLDGKCRMMVDQPPVGDDLDVDGAGEKTSKASIPQGPWMVAVRRWRSEAEPQLKPGLQAVGG